MRIVKYSPRSGFTCGALLAETSPPPLNEDQTRDLLLEIKRQGGFTDKEMESCREGKWQFELCSFK